MCEKGAEKMSEFENNEFLNDKSVKKKRTAANGDENSQLGEVLDGKKSKNANGSKEKSVSAKKKNIHEGHRKRLVELAYRVGLENLSPVQQIELFLCYILPRGDVNPLAHELIDEFDCLNHVVDADLLDICRIKGINELSAMKISLFKEFFFLYVTSRMKKKEVITCRGDIIDVVEDYLRFRNTEHLVLIALSHANIITHVKLIASKHTNQVELSPLELTGFLSSSKPAALVVAHCHPYGRATPSESDESGFEMIKNICFNCGVRVIDSYIVGEDGVFGQFENKLVRTYHDIDQLKELLTNF